MPRSLARWDKRPTIKPGHLLRGKRLAVKPDKLNLRAWMPPQKFIQRAAHELNIIAVVMVIHYWAPI